MDWGRVPHNVGKAAAVPPGRLVGKIKPPALLDSQPELIDIARRTDPEQLATYVRHLLATRANPSGCHTADVLRSLLRSFAITSGLLWTRARSAGWRQTLLWLFAVVALRGLLGTGVEALVFSFDPELTATIVLLMAYAGKQQGRSTATVIGRSTVTVLAGVRCWASSRVQLTGRALRTDAVDIPREYGAAAIAVLRWAVPQHRREVATYPTF